MCDFVAESKRMRDNSRVRIHRLAAVTLALAVAPPGHAAAADELKSTVLIFVSVDCPVSNRYAPEIQRLYQTFATRGIRFELVYPNPADSRTAIDRHIKAFSLPPVAHPDPDGKLVRLTGVTVTPEAVVFDGQGTIVYRGRIDDRFVAPGRERPAATVYDLRNALQSVSRGTPVAVSNTQAVGCFISDFQR